ncbi:MAG: hypothetical protein R3E83_08050 [Burkholderiaceae bacterium]
MGKHSRFGRFFRSAILAVSPLVAAGAVSAQAVEPHEPLTPWRIAKAVNDSTAHLVHVASGGSLHAICTRSECDMFVEPAAGCVPGQVYPVLANSAVKVGVMPSRCVLVRDDDQPKLVVHIAKPGFLVGSLLSARDLSLAFPTQDGLMNVLDIRMQGAASLLRDALGALPAQAAAERGPDGHAALDAIVRNSVSRYRI